MGKRASHLKSFGVLAGILLIGLFEEPPRADAGIMTTYVTGESAGSNVIFKVTLDASIAGSGTVGVAVTEDRGLHLDGIDFAPHGDGHTGVMVGIPDGKVGFYNVVTGATLPDFIADTSAVAGATGSATHPSSVLSTPTHLYYVENQFGFDGSSDHRIMRKAFSGGPEEVVFDGGVAGAGGLVEFEGLEIVDDRLYFFAQDPAPAPAATTRALMSIDLDGAGIWDGSAPTAHITGLARGAIGGPPVPGVSDGSDELDFDPSSGLLFGTNIINGEFIAYDPGLGMEVVPGLLGSTSHFIDGGHFLSAGAEIDGIRADGDGHLVFTGRGGIIGAIDIENVMTLGAADLTSVYTLFDSPAFTFDDLTPLIAVPEPTAVPLLLVATGLGLFAVRRRRHCGLEGD